MLVGLVNTLLTGSIFYGLSFLLPGWLAYTCAFTLGLFFVATITPRLVFSVRPPMARRLAYILWYVVVYLVGLVCVAVLGEGLQLGRLPTVIITLVVTSTLGFLGGRVLLTRRSRGERN
jgi:hypothetical protein